MKHKVTAALALLCCGLANAGPSTHTSIGSGGGGIVTSVYSPPGVPERTYDEWRTVNGRVYHITRAGGNNGWVVFKGQVIQTFPHSVLMHGTIGNLGDERDFFVYHWESGNPAALAAGKIGDFPASSIGWLGFTCSGATYTDARGNLRTVAALDIGVPGPRPAPANFVSAVRPAAVSTNSNH